MPKPNIQITDAATGAEIEREMTDFEYENYLAVIAEAEKIQKIESEKALAKELLLQKLGITEDEAKLLLS